jgi:hypothetical protein
MQRLICSGESCDTKQNGSGRDEHYHVNQIRHSRRNPIQKNLSNQNYDYRSHNNNRKANFTHQPEPSHYFHHLHVGQTSFLMPTLH